MDFFMDFWVVDFQNETARGGGQKIADTQRVCLKIQDLLDLPECMVKSGDMLGAPFLSHS